MANKKKMTMKQFKELVNFDTYGWEGIVNQIIICERACAKQSRELGCNVAAEKIERQADKKYEALKALGYYDWIYD